MWRDGWYALKGIGYVVVFIVGACVLGCFFIVTFIMRSLIEIGKGEKTA